MSQQLNLTAEEKLELLKETLQLLKQHMNYLVSCEHFSDSIVPNAFFRGSKSLAAILYDIISLDDYSICDNIKTNIEYLEKKQGCH